MKAYFDESGDDPRDKIYVLAGWAADGAVWSSLGADWKSLLAESGIQYFKHNEARGLKKQFAGWSPTRRDQLISSLVDIACSHQITGLVSSFKHPLYRLLLEGSEIPSRHLKKMAFGGYSSPYYFCFHLAVSQLLRYLVDTQRATEQVDFVFDDRNDVLRPCIKLYETIREELPSEIKAIAGSAAPGNDRNEPALQLADLLAGQIIANVRAGAPEATLQKLASCRTILKCRIEPEDLSRFKTSLNVANRRWKELGLGSS